MVGSDRLNVPAKDKPELRVGPPVWEGTLGAENSKNVGQWPTQPAELSWSQPREKFWHR